MAIGRLAWRTPTGALLWEIWGRRRWKFLWHVVALLAAIFCAQWKERGASEMTAMLLTIIALNLFMASFFALLAWFGYMEINVEKFQFGFPSRLMLKPVSTVRLTLTPMLFAGATITAQLLLWDFFVLTPIAHPPSADTLFLAALILSFFWWMQAVAWTALFQQGQVLLLLAVGVVHLLAWSLAQIPDSLARDYRWVTAAVLLFSACPAALAGQKWSRSGTWVGLSAPSILSRFWQTHPTRRVNSKFGSPFHAQFWFEWRRFGWALPSVVAAIDFVILPCLKWAMSRPGQNTDFQLAALEIMLVAPLIVAGVLGIGVGDFDVLQPGGGVPVYIAARPMANGGYVLAKFAMSFVASGVSWLITVAAALLWLSGKDSVLSRAVSESQFGLGGFVFGCVPLLLVLTLLTWKGLLGGMAARLTGRAWISGLSTAVKIISFFGLFALIFISMAYSNFQEALVKWSPFVLIAWASFKLAVAAAAFVVGLRSKSMTKGFASWVAAAWFACGFFALGYAWLVCFAVNKPAPWLWLTPIAFLIFPVSDLAIAPLAMRWNRHR